MIERPQGDILVPVASRLRGAEISWTLGEIWASRCFMSEADWFAFLASMAQTDPDSALLLRQMERGGRLVFCVYPREIVWISAN